MNVYIASSCQLSRRQADIIIKKGKVQVDGKTVDKPYYQVDEGSKVYLDGKEISPLEKVYLVFNKPKGVVCTRRDRFCKKTIFTLLPEKYRHLHYAGRLDKNSSGLVILTNDGNFSYRLTHPKFEVEKEYLIKVKGKITARAEEKALKGVKEGRDILRVKRIKFLSGHFRRYFASDKKYCFLKVITTEGRKRHLRRLFKKIGFPVEELKRIRIGKLELGRLSLSGFRIIKPEEVI